MERWRGDKKVMKWKEARRAAIYRSPIPDQFGPIEGYPCADKCPAGGLRMENTACPMMFPQEAKMFAEALTPSTVVWEWGSGSSSLYFSQCVANWTSIEHSMGWCREMQGLVPPNTKVICVPIESEFEASFGDPGTWDGSKREFRTYVEAVSHVAGGCVDCVDVVLIDGRARGDCSLEVLPYLRKDSLVFIHDWMPSRFGGTEQYDKALKHYDVVEEIHVPPPQEEATRASSSYAPRQDRSRGPRPSVRRASAARGRPASGLEGDRPASGTAWGEDVCGAHRAGMPLQGVLQ
ncbi:hypothetical protein T484DRAFT_2371702 [Baffinella frigidus]|nr:hypothetical protein T484DRAFT_2371702 [Cryptophyta sp. CCMP2293]